MTSSPPILAKENRRRYGSPGVALGEIFTRDLIRIGIVTGAVATNLIVISLPPLMGLI